MRHAVHRETVRWTLRPSDAAAVGKALGSPILVLEILPEAGAATSPSEFDDTPSVVRALLIGYDEV